MSGHLVIDACNHNQRYWFGKCMDCGWGISGGDVRRVHRKIHDHRNGITGKYNYLNVDEWYIPNYIENEAELKYRCKKCDTYMLPWPDDIELCGVCFKRPN